ncbi:MAG: M24 family metallopeptidase [Actinomycetota bacterium]
MDRSLRRDRVVERLEALNLDALLVTRLPNVRYLTGYTGSNGQAVVGRERSVFFTDGRYIAQSSREVPDLERVIYSNDFPGTFRANASELGAIRIGFESAGVTHKLFRQLSSLDGLELVPTEEEIERLRWVKEAEELELIREAQRITDDAYDAILPKLSEGVSERDIALELDWSMLRAGAEDMAFESIVAFGESASEPHHSPTSRKLRRGELVKLDFGALYEGYHSDMTRTVSFGEPSTELRDLYDLVRRSQQAGVDAVRSGIEGKDADRASRSVIEDAGYGERFSHGLGHGVGLEIHEGPTLRSNSEEVLPVGAVVTVEPGVYIPGEAGVRIEDMVEVTEDGCRVIPTVTKELVVL